MIRDTCCCGAQVEINLPRHSLELQSVGEAEHHKWWLASHEDCRTRGPVEVTNTTTWEVHVMESEEPVATASADGVYTPEPIPDEAYSTPMPTPRPKVWCHCGSPGWGANGCCGVSGCNNVPA